MHELLFPMNLQFFAEDGVTDPEIAEPGAEEIVEPEAEATVEGAEGQEVAEPAESTQVQSPEENARYAAARRAAEEQQKQIDTVFAQRFGNFKNPVTGKPIQSAKDYLDAMEAQEHLNRLEQLRQNGVDPGLLNDAIMNSPAMKQAQQYIDMQNEQKAASQIERDLKAISAIDPAIKTINDLAQQENFPEIMQMVRNHNLTVDMAYKLVNMDKITQRQSAAAQQAAINQAKSKSHLNAFGGGSATKQGLVEIPADELAKWKEYYPDLTPDQLKEKYNSVL